MQSQIVDEDQWFRTGEVCSSVCSAGKSVMLLLRVFEMTQMVSL